MRLKLPTSWRRRLHRGKIVSVFAGSHFAEAQLTGSDVVGIKQRENRADGHLQNQYCIRM